MKGRVFRAGVSLPLAIVVVALGSVAACDGTPAAEAGAPPAALVLDADSASNPTVAMDARTRTTYMAWVGTEAGQSAVFVAAVDSSGVVSEPVRANDIPGDAAPHLQAPAQVAVGPEGAVYVLWQNNTPIEGRRFPASDLRLAVSTDRARTFRPAITVNDDVGGPPSSHTFHDLAVAADGTVYVSWIDSRERDAVAHQRMPAMGHAAGMREHSMDAHGAHGGGSAEGARPVAASHQHAVHGGVDGPEIRVARSQDGGRSFEASVVVDSAACPCCRTSLALGEDGAVYVAWRKIFPGDVRDIVVARADPELRRFTEPARVHRDEWVFPACPHAGPSLALDGAGRLLVGWYTGKEGRQGLWYAVSEDGGNSFSSPAAVLTDAWVPPSQLRLAIEGERVWAVWDDRTGEQPLIRVATGTMGKALEPLEEWSAPGGDPALTAGAEGAVVSWLHEGTALARRIEN